MFILKDAVLASGARVADPEADIPGNTFREGGSEMWKRRELKKKVDFLLGHSC